METEKALDLISPAVRALRAYHLEPHQCPVKLNQNENPFGWSANVRERIADFCQSAEFNRYPDFIPNNLKSAIAAYAGVDPQQIIAGNGSNEILLVLYLNLLSSHRRVILCQPTFTVYQLLARGMGVEPLEIPLTDNLTFDMDAICNAIGSNPGALLIICSPNNPTGNSLSKEQIERIISLQTGFLVLDQAYVEFGGFNACTLTSTTPNLIVTRTFSKALGAAGLRLGYLIAHPEVVSQLAKMKLPYNINRFTEFAATELLRDRQRIDTQVSFLCAERERLIDSLRSSGFSVFNSEANFFIVRHGCRQQLFDHLKADGILVRDVSSYPLLENCLRINVGSESENDLLLASLLSFKPYVPLSRSNQ